MRSILTTIIILAFAALSIAAQCSDADKRALEKFDRDWAAAGESGNRAALNAIYADDYSDIFGSETKSSAIANTIANVERVKADPTAGVKNEYGHYLITCTPNSATITHRNKTWPADGKGEPEYSRSVHVLEKRNGKWQVVSNAGHGLTDEMMLGYMEMDWVDAMVKNDADYFDSTLAPEYVTVEAGTGELRSRSAVLRSVKAKEMKFDSARILDIDVRVDGNVGIVTGIGHGIGTAPDGSKFDGKVRFMDTYVKRNGKWRAIASHTSMLPETGQTAKK